VLKEIEVLPLALHRVAIHASLIFEFRATHKPNSNSQVPLRPLFVLCLEQYICHLPRCLKSQCQAK
jgi:hypothetical protein